LQLEIVERRAALFVFVKRSCASLGQVVTPEMLEFMKQLRQVRIEILALLVLLYLFVV